MYYHIHTGAKEFYFIRPTEHNLKAYTTWSGSAELQQREWLGDMCEGGVEKVRLLAGDTMIIPAGYIHAVVRLYLTQLTTVYTRKLDRLWRQLYPLLFHPSAVTSKGD